MYIGVSDYSSRLNIVEQQLIDQIESRQQNAILNKLLHKGKQIKSSNSNPFLQDIYLDWQDSFINKRKRRYNTQIQINSLRKQKSKFETSKNKQINYSSNHLKTQKNSDHNFTHYSQSVQLPKLTKNFNQNRIQQDEMTAIGNRNKRIKYKTTVNSKMGTIQENMLPYQKPLGKIINKQRQRNKISSSKNSKKRSQLNQSIKKMKLNINQSNSKAKIMNRKVKVNGIKKQWQQIDILKMTTYFFKMITNKRQGNHGEEIGPNKKEKQKYFSVPTRQNIPNFIKNYSPINPHINIDNLVKSPNFAVVYDDKSQQQALYFGEIIQSKKVGLGIYATKNMRYEGQWINDQKASGYQRTPQGYYCGKFKKNKRHGQGQYFWKSGQYYSGEWYHGLKNGSGLWKSKQGDSYLGQWSLGKVQGSGVHLTHTGQRYEGQFQNFLKEGKGKQLFPNGDIYEGKYKNGKPNGFGKYTWKNGIIYTGEFIDGYRHGRGNLTAKQYLKFDGIFKKDKPHGYGELIYSNGTQFRGQFVKGFKQGKGIMKIKNQRKILQGFWEKDEFLQNFQGSQQR